jgi:hypothetical protein
LNALGALAIVEPGQVDPISCADAGGAIDEVLDPWSTEPK